MKTGVLECCGGCLCFAGQVGLNVKGAAAAECHLQGAENIIPSRVSVCVCERDDYKCHWLENYVTLRNAARIIADERCAKDKST